MAGGELPHRDERSPALGSAGAGLPQQRVAAGLANRVAAASAVALAAFLCYHATLVPGLDLGDSASFQTGAGSLNLTPRQGYPLYYALGNVFVWLRPQSPAYAMNLASAVYAAAAVAVAVWLATELAGSIVAGLAAGLFLAFSYTFWTQAVTAEVYTLHLLLVGASTAALLRWSRRQTAASLAFFYAVYAGGFGNHLSMVLLLPAFTLFILGNRRPGAGDPLRMRNVALAIAITAVAALQYAWNFRGMWSELEPPADVAAALHRFWVDVTKADWRSTLIMTVSPPGLENRPRLYWFDLRQQFGLPGVALAALGAGWMAFRRPAPQSFLLGLIFAVNLAFAWHYNVGDVYIFFLPSHYVVALWAGVGAIAVWWIAIRVTSRAAAARWAAALCLLYPIWRGYETFPIADRSRDRRAVELFDRFTTPAHGVFGVDSEWQVQNAAAYYFRFHRPTALWFTTWDLSWLIDGRTSPPVADFVAANSHIGRKVIVTQDVLSKFKRQGYRGNAVATDETASDWGPPGSPYVLAILRPQDEFPIDRAEFARVWAHLTGASSTIPDFRAYTIVLGRVGGAPALLETGDRPFRLTPAIEGTSYDIRMTSWLPTDTIRRAGFGHVIVRRRRILMIERGISFVGLGTDARPARTIYRHSIHAPIPRLLLEIRGRP